MDSKRNNFVRFRSWSSEKSSSFEHQHSMNDRKYSRNSSRTTFGRLFESFRRGFHSLKSNPTSIPRKDQSGPKKIKIFDPQDQFLQTWNKIFVLSCVVSVALDPLFFYTPVLKVNEKKKCLSFESDETLAIIASVLRSVTDAFYAIHIYFQFRTGIIPPSRVFGRGELIDDTMAIAKRYLSTYFIIDILAILPCPQKYLQSTTVRVEEMRVRKTDAEQWMSQRMLPNELRERVRRYEQYKWLETRGVEEENLIRNLPKDLRRDIKRHLCLDLLIKVPMFKKMDQQLWDPLVDRLKPVLYTQDSYIVREGDPVDEMLFIMRGNLATSTTNGGITGFFNSTADLKAGDFCGEELLTWALYPQSSTEFPISTRTVVAKAEVQAFALMAEDLKTVASRFRKLHIKELQHTFKFYSQQWRTWAACFIQSAWRRYSKKNHERALRDAENRLQFALANEAGTSASLGAIIYASKFAAHLLRALRRPKGVRTSTRSAPQRVLQLLPPKPAEPDFSGEGHD